VQRAKSSTNVELVHRGMGSFNRGDLDATLELFDANVSVHDPERTGRTFRGHDGLRQFWAEWLENWEEYRVGPKEFVEGGDAILVVGEQTGRGRSSGIDLREEIFLVYRFRAGKVIEFGLFTDRAPALDSMNG
jgi:ketosteroid isomerase-like protein